MTVGQTKGSPPRVRGGRDELPAFHLKKGFTPACAGRSLFLRIQFLSVYGALEDRLHLRLLMWDGCVPGE